MTAPGTAARGLPITPINAAGSDPGAPGPVPEMLGTPWQVGRLTLRNRIVSPPMERNYSTVDGRVTDRYIAYLRARAAGGAALLFTEATYIRADGRGRTRQLGAHGDHCIPGLRALADAVHAEGALIGVELNHSGRVGEYYVSGLQSVAPSAVPFGGRMPRVLSTAEVEELVAAFADAARRCVEAGIDVIELHAAHGYLIHEFLSHRTNQRTDRYGDPVAFLNEVLVAVRAAGPETTIFVRLSAFEGVDGGLTAEQTLELAGRMRLDLLDAIDISCGSYEAGEWIVQPGEFERGVLAPFAERYRGLGKTVCVAGRLSTGDAAEAVLRAGQADLVAIGRALHADPQWSAKVLSGRAPRPCIACNQGCIDTVHTQQPIWCVVNPDTGHELAAARRPPASVRRTVLVAGGGVAGLEAARSAAERGHRVVLVEAGPALGGQFAIAASLASRPEFGRLIDWYADELARLGVDVRLSTPGDAALVTSLNPDEVINATGGVGARPPIPGIGSARVRDVRDWLAAPGSVAPEETVVIWGADRVGVAAADAIAADGHSVLIVGAQPALAPEAGRREKILAVPRLEANPAVRIELAATVESIEPDRILLGRDGSRQWLTVSGPVLVSQGTVARPLDLGPRRSVVEVGDAGFGTTADDAIRSGAAAGLAVG
jgi:2,4-dienoyl-CoA reductase-like NADH-dependent reductase (Old Yellow Enzyme family)